MAGLHPILIAAITGFLCGLLLCIPVGPVNLTIINQGARLGFKWAVLIGLGASLVEVVYCATAFTGLASFFTHGYVKTAMELTSIFFLLGLGMKFLLVKSISAPHSLETRLQTRLHPHSAFMTGFVRVMGNPGVLLYWIILALNFHSRGWVAPTWAAKGACVLGVALSTGLWFAGLSWAVSLGHRKFNERTLLRLERASGVGLLLMAALNIGQFVMEMVQAHAR